MSLAKRVPITLILFDAFDTLVTPRLPPAVQYADESRKAGLDITDDAMARAFKPSFKEMSGKHPLYGLHTGLASPDEWWTRLIELSLRTAGIAQADVESAMPTLAPSLLARFSTAKAYKLAEGVPEIFETLQEMQKKRRAPTAGVAAAERSARGPLPASLRWSLATNSDSRILEVCRALGLARYLSLGNLDLDKQQAQGGDDDTTSMAQVEQAKKGQANFESPRLVGTPDTPAGHPQHPPPSLSYFLGHEKPDSRFFHKAVDRTFYLAFPDAPPPSIAELCAQTLYVGDQYGEDFLGARQAGLQAVWLQRQQPWPSHLSARESSQLMAVQSMGEVAAIVQGSWQQ